MSRAEHVDRGEPVWIRAGVVLGGIALAVAAYRMQVNNLPGITQPSRAAAQVAAGCVFLLAGLVAWSRRPGSRMGPLMLVAGFAFLARQLRYSHDALTFTTFFALG